MASQSSDVSSPWHGAVSQSHDVKIEHSESDIEPPTKRMKKESKNLESRLSHILSCTVCLGLPPSIVYQCCRGHLMCVACHSHLLADARLKDEHATCPACRIDIGQGSCTRNLIAEKAISELPINCKFCSETFPRNSIQSHEVNECCKRNVNCKFTQLGCDWVGPYYEAVKHEDMCSHPRKSGNEILECLKAEKENQIKEMSKFSHLVSLLSFDQMAFSDIQLRPCRTDDYVTRLYYESNRFHALSYTWIVKAFISSVENNPSNPTVIAERKLTYQLVLKSKVNEELEIYSMVLKAPFDDTSIEAEPVFHRLTNENSESEIRPITVPDANKLLSNKIINIRIFLFHSKV